MAFCVTTPFFCKSPLANICTSSFEKVGVGFYKNHSNYKYLSSQKYGLY